MKTIERHRELFDRIVNGSKPSAIFARSSPSFWCLYYQFDQIQFNNLLFALFKHGTADLVTFTEQILNRKLHFLQSKLLQAFLLVSS